jgi:hypothetical protein
MASDGTLKLEQISDHGFRSLIERHCELFGRRSGPHGESLLKVGARCSLDSARAILASESRKILPPVAAVHNCPLLIECQPGRVEVLSKGYHDKAGGRLIVGGEMPEQMDITEAAHTLLGFLDEFEFATPADMSRAIAVILSPALKGLGTVRGHFPVFIIEANDSQAGKGFLLDLTHAIYREVPSFVTQRNGGVGGFDESLSQALTNARPFVQFDNIRGRIDSMFLEAILTCPLGGTIAARVPHKGEIQSIPTASPSNSPATVWSLLRTSRTEVVLLGSANDRVLFSAITRKATFLTTLLPIKTGACPPSTVWLRTGFRMASQWCAVLAARVGFDTGGRLRPGSLSRSLTCLHHLMGMK